MSGEYSAPDQFGGIKSWAEEDRPREKLLCKGSESLSTAELVAILIGSGIRDLSAVDLSRQILNSVGNDLNRLARLSVKDLTAHRGIGEARAVAIVAALELGRRRKLHESLERGRITSAADVYDLFQPLLADLPHEEFWVLHLNRSNRVIVQERISKGGVAGTVADIKMIFKSAVQHLASSVILCHNHPSESPSPSKADADLTKKVAEAGRLLEIQVLDHVIVAGRKYYSFADDGAM